MIKKIKPRLTLFPKRLLQIPSTTNICTCTKNFGEGYNLKWISNHQQLMAVTDEPIFITGRSDWQEKELEENTRELGLCKHFMKQFTVEYLCYFMEELVRKKQNYLERHEIAHPVTFYAWYYVCSVSGTPFLCYDFISGYNPQLPFGGKYFSGLHAHTFMRKFLDFKIKKTETKKIYVFTDTLKIGSSSNCLEACSTFSYTR